jgi:hypothetical protein
MPAIDNNLVTTRLKEAIGNLDWGYGVPRVYLRSCFFLSLFFIH